MKKNWKRVGVIVLALLMVIMLLPLGSFKAHAEEGESDSEDLGKTYKVGDIIKFGHYEQDGDTTNGKEDIEWQVLKVESDRVLVISKYALDYQPYNATESEVTWETCSLRRWLNKDFKNTAFTEVEQKRIPTVTVVNTNNFYYGTIAGVNTNDQIFCLSFNEVKNLIGFSYYDDQYKDGYNQNLIVEPTPYAIKNGAKAATITEYEYYGRYTIPALEDMGYTDDVIGRIGCNWWLRTPGESKETACQACYNGEVSCYYWTQSVEKGRSVRPALYIDFSIITPTSIELNKTSENMTIGEELKLDVSFSPSDTTEKGITWTSSKPRIATVEDGVVKAVGEGVATITAKAVNDSIATCEISVTSDSGYHIGDTIKFGNYEQDGNDANGKEPIEWQILAVEEDCFFLVSKYVLDYRELTPYRGYTEDVSWETCTLRTWLNNDFKNTAFTAAQRKMIPTVTVESDDNPENGCSGGWNTQDQIFILNFTEISEYIGFSTYNQYMTGFIRAYNPDLIVEPTQYAINKGLYAYTHTSGDTAGRIGCQWWIRTPGCDVSQHISQTMFCCIEKEGEYRSSHHTAPSAKYGIRPALYVYYDELATDVEPESISLNRTSASLSCGEKITLSATLTPDDVTDKTITWTSSNPGVATVANGVVKAISEGTTTITAKTVNDLSATCKITVRKVATDGIFADIQPGTWQYNAAKSVYDKGYMTGTGTVDGKIVFSPNTDMNRTMFVQALYSMEGKPAVTYVQKFTDVTENAWYAKAVTWASNNGIVAGNPDGTFGINGKATREQMALMLYKYAKYKNYDVSVNGTTSLDGFSDAGKVSGWAVTAVKWAVERGIISGKGNAQTGYRIAPTEKATRIECAAMLNKFDEFYAGALTYVIEDIEEPLALPEEDMDVNPLPEEETEDIIIDEDEEIKDEDVPSEDEKEKDVEEQESEEDPAEDAEE